MLLKRVHFRCSPKHEKGWPRKTGRESAMAENQKQREKKKFLNHGKKSVKKRSRTDKFSKPDQKAVNEWNRLFQPFRQNCNRFHILPDTFGLKKAETALSKYEPFFLNGTKAKKKLKLTKTRPNHKNSPLRYKMKTHPFCCCCQRRAICGGCLNFGQRLWPNTGTARTSVRHYPRESATKIRYLTHFQQRFTPH